MSKLVVYGGAGGLGRALVQHFKTKGYVRDQKREY
jgi:dihydropteridine reductase